MKDYYQILSVPGNATQTEIRKAYYKLAKQYHPDTNSEATHHHKFLDINEAYQILGDKQKREIYHYRWIVYKNQTRAKATAAPTARQTATHTQATQPASGRKQATYRQQQAPPPPFFHQHYRNYTRPDYREYELALKRVSLFVLILSFLLIADKFLAYRLENEPITRIELPKSGNSSETPVYVNTRHTHFQLSLKEFQHLELMPGDLISMKRTPFFSQVTHIYFQGEPYKVNRGTVYHNFFLLLLFQIVAAGAGLNRKFQWPTRMNAGIIAGCFGGDNLNITVSGLLTRKFIRDRQ